VYLQPLLRNRPQKATEFGEITQTTQPLCRSRSFKVTDFGTGGHTGQYWMNDQNDFLPRCMKCRRGIAMRILSVCLSVCPSVCQSVTRVIPDKTVERLVQIFIPYERTFILVF